MFFTCFERSLDNNFDISWEKGYVVSKFSSSPIRKISCGRFLAKTCDRRPSKLRSEKPRYFPGNGTVSAGLYFTISRIYSRRIAPRQSARI